MNTRFVFAILIFSMSFGMPLFANADTICERVEQPCSYTGSGGNINGTCNASMVCVPTQTQCERQGPNTQCTTSSGVYGTCDAFNVCQPSSGGIQTSSGTKDQRSSGNPNNTVSKPASGPNVTLINPLGGGSSLEGFLNAILKFVIRIGAIIIVLMLVYVGYKFVTARGEPGKISEARQNLLWTVVGALILLGAQAIALAIEATVKAISVGG